MPDEHTGRNSCSQCKLHGLSAEGKETERMSFQDWELGKQAMDGGDAKGQEEMEEPEAEERGVSVSAGRVFGQEPVVGWRGVDRTTGESAPGNVSLLVLSVQQP